MVTEADSWVALSAVDSAVYGVRGKAKRAMQRVKCTSEVTMGWGSVTKYGHWCRLWGRKEVGCFRVLLL